MPRQSKLRKKKVGKTTYWYTETGGETYFGNVDSVPYSEAKNQFNQHVISVTDAQKNAKTHELTAGELMDFFLDWIEKHRSQRTYSTRKTHCNRFGKFRVKGMKIGDLPARKLQGSDLEAWLEHLESEGHSAQTRRHAQTSIKHCWNWASKYPSPTPYLSPMLRPFSSVERIFVSPKTLTEADLITDDEIKALFAATEIDPETLDGPKTARPAGKIPYRSFADMLRCYYWTGARTDELAQCRVADLLFRTSQVILGKHKRSKTQRTPTIRHITLNGEALAVFKKHCDGKQETDHVFVKTNGKPLNRNTLAERYNLLKVIAAEKKLGKVRSEITIYSFRDLWISEALMAGNDVATVARMAGTSIAMIERVYGHFRNQHLLDAQARVDQLRRQRGR